MVALIFGYEVHKNIYTDILNGPLKEIKLKVKSRGEGVAPWNCAKQSRLHDRTPSTVKRIQRGQWDGASGNFFL